jgi:hypothetical protein
MVLVELDQMHTHVKFIDSEMLVDHACGLTVCFKASTCRCNVAVLLPSIKTAFKEAVCLLTLHQVAGCKCHAPTRVDTIIMIYLFVYICPAGELVLMCG